MSRRSASTDTALQPFSIRHFWKNKKVVVLSAEEGKLVWVGEARSEACPSITVTVQGLSEVCCVIVVTML